MPQQTHDALILELASLLVGRQVDTDAVDRALALLCAGFSFDRGMVYQVDHFNYFHLMEHCYTGQAPKEQFDFSDLRPEYRSALAHEQVTYIRRQTCDSPCHAALLALFSADTLVVAPVADEHLRIHGLIVFGSAQADALTESARNGLECLLSMLTRYVGVRMYQNKLVLAQTSLESILDNTGIDIYVNDFYSHDILYVNRSMAAPYGGQEQFMGKKCWQTLFPGQSGPCAFCPQTQLIDENGEPTKVYTWDYQRAFDGSWFRVFSAAFRWVDGRLAHVVSSADITDNKQKEALIEYMANYDALTGLPNRRMLISACERYIDRADEGEPGYVLFFDIDGFKAINDSLGHDAGDAFLKQLGEFFSGIPLLKDAIYRNGGDEFVAVLGGAGVTKDQIQHLASFILHRFQSPWALEGGDVICGVSVGVACFPEDGHTADELLRKADLAMYRVKNGGGGGFCFASQLR